MRKIMKMISIEFQITHGKVSNLFIIQVINGSIDSLNCMRCCIHEGYGSLCEMKCQVEIGGRTEIRTLTSVSLQTLGFQDRCRYPESFGLPFRNFIYTLVFHLSTTSSMVSPCISAPHPPIVTLQRS